MGVDRLPPQNIEAEQSVLGSLLIDSDAIVRIAPFLHAEDFYRETHGLISVSYTHLTLPTIYSV